MSGKLAFLTASLQGVSSYGKDSSEQNPKGNLCIRKGRGAVRPASGLRLPAQTTSAAGRAAAGTALQSDGSARPCVSPATSDMDVRRWLAGSALPRVGREVSVFRES